MGETGIIGSKANIFKNKLKRLEAHIKEWKRSLGDTVPVKVKAFLQEMNDWEMKAEVTDLSGTEKEDFTTARLRYFRAAKEQSLVLKQRSRVKWAADGDENSAFFHGIIKGRMKRNSLKGIALNGVWLEEPTRLKQEVFGYLQRHFSETQSFVQSSQVRNSRS